MLILGIHNFVCIYAKDFESNLYFVQDLTAENHLFIFSMKYIWKPSV